MKSSLPTYHTILLPDNSLTCQEYAVRVRNAARLHHLEQSQHTHEAVQTVDRPYYTVQYDQLTIRYNPDLGGALQRGERYRGPGARGSGGGLLVTLSRPGLSVIQSQRASTTAIDTVIASRNVASTENRPIAVLELVHNEIVDWPYHY